MRTWFNVEGSGTFLISFLFYQKSNHDISNHEPDPQFLLSPNTPLHPSTALPPFERQRCSLSSIAERNQGKVKMNRNPVARYRCSCETDSWNQHSKLHLGIHISYQSATATRCPSFVRWELLTSGTMADGTSSRDEHCGMQFRTPTINMCSISAIATGNGIEDHFPLFLAHVQSHAITFAESKVSHKRQGNGSELDGEAKLWDESSLRKTAGFWSLNSKKRPSNLIWYLQQPSRDRNKWNHCLMKRNLCLRRPPSTWAAGHLVFPYGGF